MESLFQGAYAHKPPDDIEAREVRPDELAEMLEVRNAIFPPITPEDWKKGEPATAAVALQGGKMIGAIPLVLREFQIAPGCTVRAAFENAVGTLAEARSRGVGSAMIAAARRFLLGRVDALMVYRGAERSAGYRFYERTGHFDLECNREYTGSAEDVYHACMRRVKEQEAGGRPSQRASRGMEDRFEVEVGTAADIRERGPELLRISERAFGRYGGFPARAGDYWQNSLDSVIYKAIPTEFLFFQLIDRDQSIKQPTGAPANRGRLQGYAIAGLQQRTKDQTPRFTVLDMAVIDQAFLERLMAAVAGEAVARGCDITLYSEREHPYDGSFLSWGFAPAPSENRRMIMGQLLDPASALRRAWPGDLASALGPVALSAWTPQRSLSLYSPPGGALGGEVVLELKEVDLTRLLMRRMDFGTALKEQRVTCRPQDDRIIDVLSKHLTAAPWTYHHLDYI